MIIQYNQQIEVTSTQYKYCVSNLAGIIAHREEDGKYYIKLWNSKYKQILSNILEKIK